MAREMKDSGILWIKEIPKSWTIVRGKYILKLFSKPVKEDDGVITCFRDGEVTLRSNRREDGFTISDKEIGYQGIDVGDLVVHGMDGFAGAIGISDSRGKASPVLNVLDTIQNKKYIMYYLRSMAYSDVFTAIATGIRVRSCDLRWNKLAELFYPIPSLQEQKKIADYLGEKCAEIEELKADIQSQIDIFEDYKKSVITEAVTKGLNPDVEMKDSGIEWIGEIPKNWNIIKIKYLCKMQSGDNITAQDINSEKDEINCYEVYGANGFRGYYKYYTHIGKYCLIGRQGALAGNVHLIDNIFWATDHAVVVYVNNKVSQEYMYYLFLAMNLNQYAFDTAAQPGLAVSKIMNLQMALPPYTQQQLILDFLNKKCFRIDRTIKEKKEQLDVLEQYKKSLIYEYVTGKKEVL